MGFKRILLSQKGKQANLTGGGETSGARKNQQTPEDKDQLEKKRKGGIGKKSTWNRESRRHAGKNEQPVREIGEGGGQKQRKRRKTGKP